MQTTDYSRRELAALYDDIDAAERARSALLGLGIPASDIRLLEGETQGSPVEERRESTGFFDMLANLFMPDDDRTTYAEGLTRGGHLLTVRVPDRLTNGALDVLDDEGAVDMEDRIQQWQGEGWTPPGSGSFEATRMGVGTAATMGDAAADVTGETGVAGGAADHETINRVEERLAVGKRDVSLGRVRVRSYVIEEPVSADVSLRSERVQIDRRAVDRPVSDADAVFRDRTIEVEETEEEPVVAKTARVIEEIDVSKAVDEHQETVIDTVRRTEVDIEDDRDDETRR